MSTNDTTSRQREPNDGEANALLALLDASSTFLLRWVDTLVDDPDVRLAAAGLAEQIAASLRSGGRPQAVHQAAMVRTVACGRRCGR